MAVQGASRAREEKHPDEEWIDLDLLLQLLERLLEIPLRDGKCAVAAVATPKKENTEVGEDGLLYQAWVYKETWTKTGGYWVLKSCTNESEREK